MKAHLSLLVLAATALLWTAPAFAQQGDWGTDYAKAVQQARSENKAILLDFTGSDWCGWCIKMKKETLDTPQFTTYAHQNLVLVTLDFPQRTLLTPQVRQQNDKLKTQYGAGGFPTFILVDGSGRELGRQVGYLSGGPSAFIAKLTGFHPPVPVVKKATDSGDDFDSFFKKSSPAPTP